MRLHNWTEHQKIYLKETDSELHELLKLRLENSEITQNLPSLQLLGMDYDFRAKCFNMSYYVGTDWIDKQSEQAMIITPKRRGIDFQSMFMQCFNCKGVNQNLDQLFYIRTEDTPIRISTEDFQLEPLLIIYFINIVAQIVSSGLRKDYKVREEQLIGKIKGKVLTGLYIKHGIATNRKDKVHCRYQEYDVDCIDNRILKSALILCKEMINRNAKQLKGQKTDLQKLLQQIFPHFEQVSEKVTPQELQHVHINPLFKNYKSAIQIAKMIIKKQGYCVHQEKGTNYQHFPPFIINMPLLFERYVYSLLHERYKDEIRFQVSTRGNYMDFSKRDEHLVIDTKYIFEWENENNHENIRQLSGYARNRALRVKMGLQQNDENSICPCLIIYPQINPDKPGFENLCDFDDKLFEDKRLLYIHEYIRFKKLPIYIPLKK